MCEREREKIKRLICTHAEQMKRDEHANEFNLLVPPMLQESRISLLRIVEYYNFVREKTEKCEFDIISGQVEVIAADLTILLENFTWINFGKCTYSICLCTLRTVTFHLFVHFGLILQLN